MFKVEVPVFPPELTERIDCAEVLLNEAAIEHGPAVLGSSMGAEDMVLIDMIATAGIPIGVFTLDTGRLHPETHALIQLSKARYDLPITVYMPEPEAVEALVMNHGPDGFYNSVEVRQACCQLRKVAPLRRALAGHRSWITGMRRAQSVTRAEIKGRAWDSENAMEKYNPLAAWSADDVWTYIRERHVPYNRLHDEGYVSIGCAPCTRAITVGEDERAGRWWWENPETRECGLHLEKSRA